MMITQSINLNLIPGGVLPRINVSQYDKGSRTLQFVLFDGPVLYSIESGTEITIQGSKPDNTAFQYDCTWSGSTVSMDIEQQMTAVAGDVICELVISNDGEILGTCNFILNVESAAVSDDTVISETELPLIERAVEAATEAAASAASAAQSAEDAAGYVETVETAAQNAAQSATDASDSAGTAQTAAQNAAQSATDASSSAGTAQTAAQSAAQSATDASSSAGTAQTAAQNAAQSATDASGSASSASQSATDAAASAQAAAQSAASIGIATTTHAGIVKPDGTTITVDQDGTIHGNASATVDSALSTTSVNPVQNKVITSALGKVEANIAPVETDPATNAWAVGRQIIFNDNLYEVIAVITAGDALVAYEDDPTNANIKLAPPVETQLTDISDEIADMNNVLGAKNLLQNNATSQIINGVTCTVNTDKSISTNGVYTGSDGVLLRINTNFTVSQSGEYILTGTPFIQLEWTFLLYIVDNNASSIIAIDLGQGVNCSLDSSKTYSVVLWCKLNFDTSGYTIKPMIRPASITDDTYEPYAMTNRQLTAEIQTLESEIGDLTDLDTTVKTDLVSAVNEVKASAGGALYFSGQACSALTGDFCTISNANITADHVVAEAVFANPSAITTDVTWTTASGSLKLNGTCASATTVNIVLVKKNN